MGVHLQEEYKQAWQKSKQLLCSNLSYLAKLTLSSIVFCDRLFDTDLPEIKFSFQCVSLGFFESQSTEIHVSWQFLHLIESGAA